MDDYNYDGKVIKRGYKNANYGKHIRHIIGKEKIIFYMRAEGDKFISECRFFPVTGEGLTKEDSRKDFILKCIQFCKDVGGNYEGEKDNVFKAGIYRYLSKSTYEDACLRFVSKMLIEEDEDNEQIV